MSGIPEAFYPPRAPGGVQVPRWRTLARSAWESLDARVSSLRLGGAETAGLLSAIPGAGHFWQQRRARWPAVILGLYLMLFIWHWLYVPAAWGPMLFAVLFGFHQWVVLDAMRRARQRTGERGRRGLDAVKEGLKVAVLLGSFYFFVGWCTEDFGRITRVSSDRLAPTIRAGDRLWIVARKAYRRGDIVVVPGRGLERVVAVGGDTVSLSAAGLRINGAAAAPGEGPIAAAYLSDSRFNGVELQVPRGCYVVMFPAHFEGLTGMGAFANFIVNQRQISGAVAWKF